jgi:uncharacterized repeat protein (TIGR01451 family)
VDLSISGTSTPAPTADIGEALSYDYTVTNNSAGSADGVSVQIELPQDNDGGLTTTPNANSSESVLPFDLALQTSSTLSYGKRRRVCRRPAGCGCSACRQQSERSDEPGRG